MNKVADTVKLIGGWLIVVGTMRMPVWAVGVGVLLGATLARLSW